MTDRLNTKDHLQALADGLSAQWMRDRAQSQMTLGKMIAALEAMPADAEMDDLREPHSYRGYYSDLAFERFKGKCKAADVLSMCKAAMGQVFHGYKGGDFVMGALTPVWIAHYGCCGEKIMAINGDGSLTTEQDEY